MSISIGNKIELIKLEDVIKNTENKNVYISKIYDIITPDSIQIAMPIFNGKIVPLPVNEKFSACFYTDSGLLQCNVIITSRYKNGNLFFLDVLMLGELKKVQRREYYRYNCVLDARIREVSDHEFLTGQPESVTGDPDKPVEILWENIKILDISGGGAKIASKKQLERNMTIKITFILMIVDEVAVFDLYARILACNLMRGRDDLYELRMEFMKISQEDRDKIIRFIFESERVARAKKIGLK